MGHVEHPHHAKHEGQANRGHTVQSTDKDPE